MFDFLTSIGSKAGAGKDGIICFDGNLGLEIAQNWNLFWFFEIAIKTPFFATVGVSYKRASCLWGNENHLSQCHFATQEYLGVVYLHYQIFLFRSPYKHNNLGTTEEEYDKLQTVTFEVSWGQSSQCQYVHVDPYQLYFALFQQVQNAPALEEIWLKREMLIDPNPGRN